MATTFNWISLGTSATSLDPTEGNQTAENANAFVGQTYGSAGSPLFSKIASVTMLDRGGTAGALDTDNSSSNDQFTTKVGASTATYTFDGVAVYNATVTYADGTTGNVTAVIVQDTSGNLFLAPDMAAGQDEATYEAKPILSLTLNGVAGTKFSGLATDRYVTGFDDGYIDGSATGDLINGSYVEAIGNGTDKIDNNDAGLSGSSGNDDHIRAGSGNDSIYSANGNDTIFGGDGNDLAYGGASNDSILGEAGDDTLSGDDGNDQIFGGTGNDMLSGGTGSDTLHGGTGNDTMAGGAGNDLMQGDAGNDSLAGDAGNDSLSGGDGNDGLTGGTGNDTLTGGAGRDSYELTPTGGADRITDFSMTANGAQTEDQLDVSDLTNGDGSPVRSYDVAISNDGSGNALLTFPGGEIVVLVGVSPATAATPGMLNTMGVPCFAGGTRILTPQGERLVEDLRPGDLMSLAEGGTAPVIWHGTRSLSAEALRDLPQLRPIRLKAGHFGLTHDLVVSPQHGLRLGGVLVRARHLAALGRGAHVARGIRSVTYHHLLLPRHALIMAEGAACESFYPGPMAFASLSPPDKIRLATALGLEPGAMVTPSRIAAAYGPRCLPLASWRAVAAQRPRDRHFMDASP